MTRQFLFTLSILLYSVPHLLAQSPEAIQLWKRTSALLTSPQGHQVDLKMQILFGHDVEQELTGHLKIQEQKVRLDIDDSYLYVSDGHTGWLYLPEANEVQIDHPDPELLNQFHPMGLIQMTQSGQFEYEITGQSQQTPSILKMDFKPTDHNSLFSIITLWIDKQTAIPHHFTIRQKDGYSYDIELTNVDLSPIFSAEDFRFDIRKYPDAHIEDIRLD